MAYCVHCGVKLGAGEKRCPLCQTPVYDPAEPEKPEPKAAEPQPKAEEGSFAELLQEPRLTIDEPEQEAAEKPEAKE